MATGKMRQIRIDKLFPEPVQHTKYLTKLGRFVDNFATAEVLLNTLALEYSGVPYKRAATIFLPMRADASIKLIKKLLDDDGQKGKKAKELRAILSHLDDLREVRNVLLHYGVMQDKRKKKTAKNFFARAKVPTKSFNVSTRSLDNMNYDLVLIEYWIMYRHFGSTAAKRRDPLNRTLAKIIRPLVRRQYLDETSWLYRPPQQPARRRTTRRRKGRAPVPKPKPQP